MSRASAPTPSPGASAAAVIPPFSNHLPVRIRFGDGVAVELPEVIASHVARRVVVMVDDGLEEHNPGVAAAIERLGEADIEMERFAKPPGEPTTDLVDAATEVLQRAAPRVVVAIGGGSVIDTAKAARLCAESRTSFQAWLDSDRRFPAPGVALVAVPTTAGTGSEVSGGAVITHPDRARKIGIADATLRAQHALVDPLLTHSVPAAMTAYTGVDALAQAIAGMIAKVRTPIGDGIALEAIRMIGRSLPVAFENGENAAARSEMACGSLMAGLTMNISDCTAEHSLAQAIGGLFKLPHGLTIGLVLAETVERERHHVPAILERVADALAVPDDGTGDGSRTVRGIRDLLARLQFPVLGAVGVSEEHLDALTDIAQEDFFHTQSPVAWSRDELRAAFTAALAETERAR
ncbi:MAG TPA: iron-containing alcohol dehydrogenase [Solirubrobacteraceae bacterium]|nr:iron-containing alcohol dehydrogenase [Solirubrobacteraceae bacterium]